MRHSPRSRSVAAGLVLALACAAPALGAEGAGLVAGPELRLADRAPAGVGEVLRLRQTAAGHPVLDAEAVVVRVPGEAPRLVSDSTARIEAPPAAEPRLGAARAERLALDELGVERLRGPLRTRLGVEPRSGRLAWRVLIPSARPLADLVVDLDARSGRLLASRDVLRRAASAAVFDPNAVALHGIRAGLRDRDDRDSALLRSLRRPVALRRLRSPRGCLHGEHVEVRLGKGRHAVCRRSGDWAGVERSAGEFEALMAYFHLDRAREALDALALSRGLGQRPQRVRANAVHYDNSFYSPLRGSITLGTGGVDDGEDADVIVHEYGHAVQDRQVPLFGMNQAGAALGEGFGDYLAAAISTLGTGGDPRFDACIFEWDAVSYSRRLCARSTTKRWTLPTARRRCDNDPHCVGQAWSSALWELRAALGADGAGRPVADRVLLESHELLSRRPSFRDAARALLAADALHYGGAHQASIEAELVERAFCPTSGC